MTPTSEAYSELQLAYDTFNARLFNGELPDCLITLQREKRAYGYFSAERFSNRDGQKVDEIAMNPTFFAVLPIVEIMQTLAHEMCHLWQYHYGKPGRARYHNQEWGDKMESIGLMPSNTGQPGGKKTGDQMADYPIEGGLFLAVCADLLTDHFRLSWYDRYPSSVAMAAAGQSYGLTMGLSDDLTSIAAQEGVELAQASNSPGNVATPNKSNRVKYSCACGFNVWGKPNLRISCLECGEGFSAQD